MEVMVAVQSGTLLHALRVQLKRRVSARRGGSSLVNTPQKYKETPLWQIATENVTFRTSLTGLSVLLRNAIVIIYSRGVLQPSGIRRFGSGVSQLSPLRPVLGNGDPLIEILRNALTFERVLQRPAPSHLWTTNRPRMRYPTSQ